MKTHEEIAREFIASTDGLLNENWEPAVERVVRDRDAEFVAWLRSEEMYQMAYRVYIAKLPSMASRFAWRAALEALADAWEKH